MAEWVEAVGLLGLWLLILYFSLPDEAEFWLHLDPSYLYTYRLFPSCSIDCFERSFGVVCQHLRPCEFTFATSSVAYGVELPGLSMDESLVVQEGL